MPLSKINLPALLNTMSGTFQIGAALGVGAVLDFFGAGRVLFTVKELLDFELGLYGTGGGFRE
jgi:hypothetical protein